MAKIVKKATFMAKEIGYEAGRSALREAQRQPPRKPEIPGQESLF